MKLVRGGANLTDEQVNKLATLKCDCEEAAHYQKIEKKMTYAEANIKNILSADGEMALKACISLVHPLAEQKLRKATLLFDTGIQVQMEGKEKTIKITRKEIIKKVLED